MVNFSAIRMVGVSSKDFEKSRVSILKDRDTKRCYKVYDHSKAFYDKIKYHRKLFTNFISHYRIYLFYILWL
jgi:hypothetical protein